MEEKRPGSAAMLYRFAYGAKRYFIFAILASAFSVLFTFLMPQVIRFTVDYVIGDSAEKMKWYFAYAVERLGGIGTLRANLLFCAIGVVTCSLFSGIFNYTSRMCIARGNETFTKNLRDRLYRHTQFLPFEWHTENRTGDIIQRCSSDVDTVRNFVSNQLVEVIKTTIQLAMVLVFMFSMNVKMSLMALVFIPLIILYSAGFFGRIARQFREADEAEGELMVGVQENLTGVRVVRAFGRERYELERFDERNIGYANKWIDLGYTLGFFWGVGDAATGFQLLSIVCLGAFLAAKGELSLGELLVFVSYTQTIAWPVRSLGRTLSEMSKAGVSVERIREILDAPAESDPEDALKPDISEDIVFEHVSFAYGDAPVLSDLNFTIKRGSSFGILGATGSGKSTITYLLNRLYEPTEGRITIGGVDIRDIDRRYLRKNIGLVLQEPFLFSKTIRENMEIAAEDSDIDRVKRAAKIAAIDDNIESFTHGYDTVVGERGVTLSGGQKQRVAIARTLMLDAPVLVFDDSLSAVDMETDTKIRKALNSGGTGDSTTIIISHRINSLMDSDCILVLDGGRVAEIGSHAELMAADGIYKRIYLMQSGQGEEAFEA